MSRDPSRAWRRSELTYCSNVHPGETFDELLTTIDGGVGRVRARRRLEVMGSGLWLADSVARELTADPAHLARFGEALDRAGVQLFTLNGFPFGEFHADRVKERVYTPHWADRRRYDYTLRLAEVLASRMPAGNTEGTISTVPLGYRPGWSAALHTQALDQLCRLAADLDRLHERTGRSIRICLEMEPGCVLERTDEALALFTTELPRAADRQHVAPGVLGRHLGVCYDVCHQAVMFEDPTESLARLREAGIAVGKIQLSSALEITEPMTPAARAALARFAEPRYLHQVRGQTPGGSIVGTMDLPAALRSNGLVEARPWRVHFHVPVQTRALADGALGTTQSAIEQVLDFLRANPDLHPHLEVETYTWQVLPPGARPNDDAGLVRGLVEELVWVEQAMTARGLLH